MQIDLTKAELDLTVALMDAGVKAAGLQAVKPDLMSVLTKFAAAVQNEASKPKELNLDGND